MLHLRSASNSSPVLFELRRAFSGKRNSNRVLGSRIVVILTTRLPLALLGAADGGDVGFLLLPLDYGVCHEVMPTTEPYLVPSLSNSRTVAGRLYLDLPVAPVFFVAVEMRSVCATVVGLAVSAHDAR